MMNRIVIWTALVGAGLVVGGCGTKGDNPGDSGPMQMDDGPDGGTLSDSATTNDSNDSNDSNDDGPMTTGATTEATTGEEMTTGIGFIQDPDGGGAAFECDLFAQDCPEGEKCMPWGNDGGTWNATRCSPIVDNAGQPGDECTVEGGAASGIDDCDIGAMCWDVDGETNVGTCVAMCTGDDSNPICEDPDTTCSIANDGAIVLCLPVCDPIIQDCPEGNACYPVAEDWVCGPDASGEMGAYGDPCEFINVCDPGLVCLDPSVTPGCAGALGCCTEVCDVSDPAGNDQCSGVAGGQTCEAWYEEGMVPPGYEDVGVCVLPA